MATCIFRSALAPRLHAFWEARRSGRRGEATLKILRSIDHLFIAELKPGQPISRELLGRWIESTEHLSPGTRINRFGVMRQFCLYMSYFEPRTCILHRHCVPRRNRPAPHIYTPHEMRRIMAAARQLGPPGSLRPLVISTLIGVLYATSLRIGEALNLTLVDVNLTRRIIEVREGKFGKSRYVPLSPSTAAEIGAYLRRRRQAGFSTAPNGPVFVNVIGNRHGQPGFVTVYLDLLRRLQLRGPKGQRGPCVHDIRHTFAVQRLLAWYRQGVNLGTKLPLLSTYLGHSTVTGTEVYLHTTAQLLESAGRRFHAHFAVPPWQRGKPMRQTDIGPLIRRFFEHHLVSEHGLSGHTVLTYRDAWKLFLQFACGPSREALHEAVAGGSHRRHGAPLSPHMEQQRKNGVHTRNNRLAALHAFFAYLATTDPRHLPQCKAILAVPFKRRAARVPEYLEQEEVLKIFAAIDVRMLPG